MKTVVPDYYKDFRCIADKCRHTCCAGWEIDIDEESLPRFLSDSMIAPFIDTEDTPHIVLEEGERCPFLRNDGLCEMIIQRGEDSLCQICRDHPRFRNYWTGITEIGLGLVCEEAARLILGKSDRMKLVTLEGNEITDSFSEYYVNFSDEEQWLWDYRQNLLDNITETGCRARLKEYLIYRHIPDALYDGMVDERTRFVEDSYKEITEMWSHTDGTPDDLVECALKWSYDVEYDDEVIAERLLKYQKETI